MVYLVLKAVPITSQSKNKTNVRTQQFSFFFEVILIWPSKLVKLVGIKFVRSHLKSPKHSPYRSCAKVRNISRPQGRWSNSHWTLTFCVHLGSLLSEYSYADKKLVKLMSHSVDLVSCGGQFFAQTNQLGSINLIHYSCPVQSRLSKSDTRCEAIYSTSKGADLSNGLAELGSKLGNCRQGIRRPECR